MAETEFTSSRRCTYDEVQSWHDKDGAFELPSPEILEAVERSFELAGKIDARRDAEGRLDFEIPELKVEIGADGEPTWVKERERKASHRLIETFMVIANEEVSRMFHEGGYPFVFRVHEPPSEDNLSDLRKLFKENGIDLPFGEVTPKDLRDAYLALKAKPDMPPMEKLLLSRLSKAKYSEKALGHFGLALRYYSHFTSPIRRYPDLQIHRIIKEKLRGELSKSRQEHYSAILPVRSKQNSDAERRAESLEREVEWLEAARYMERFVGEEFDATVTGNSRLAYYVRIPEGIEGAVFLGKRSDRGEIVFPKFGTPLRVRLESVDRSLGRIDFVPAEEPPRKAAKKAARNEGTKARRPGTKEGGRWNRGNKKR